MKKNIIAKAAIFSVIGLLFLFPLLSPTLVTGANEPPTGSLPPNEPPTGQSGAGELSNPLGSGTQTIWAFLTKLIHALLPLFTIIAVFFIVLSGFQFLTAQGNPQKLETARNTFVWTLVGVAIIVGVDVIIAVLKDLASTLEI